MKHERLVRIKQRFRLRWCDSVHIQESLSTWSGEYRCPGEHPIVSRRAVTFHVSGNGSPGVHATEAIASLSMGMMLRRSDIFAVTDGRSGGIQHVWLIFKCAFVESHLSNGCNSVKRSLSGIQSSTDRLEPDVDRSSHS
jgi:hypothetical protein